MISTGHTLVIGPTMSGKTTIVRTIVKDMKERNAIGVIVLTPFAQDADWAFADYITDNADSFMDVVFSSRRCVVVIDEGSEYAGQFDKAINKVATRGRHLGHLAFFIGQSFTDINPRIRNNCVNCIAFMTSKDESRKLANHFVNDYLLKCSELKRGDFIAVIDYIDVYHGNPFTKRLSKIRNM